MKKILTLFTALILFGSMTVQATYYVTGIGGWSATQVTMDQVGTSNVYSKSFDVGTDKVQFKVTDGSWNDGHHWGWSNAKKNLSNIYLEESGGNVSFTLAASSNVTIYFNSDNKNIYVIDNNVDYVTFFAGTTLYYRLTGSDATSIDKGYNIYNAAGEEYGTWKDNTTLADPIPVTLTNDLVISANANLFKSNRSSWNGVKCATLPTTGQNMIVSTDGATCHWDTYSGGAPEPTPATIQLHSNITNPSWESSANFTLAGNEETASLTLTSVTKGSYEFGVKIDGTWTSNGSAFTRVNNSHEIVAGSGNCTFNADRNGDYTFTWTYATNTLAVTYPAVPAQSVTFNSLASEILKGSVINLANCVTSSGIDDPTYRFYIKEKNGSYGDAINANYTFNANGEYVVKVEALEYGEPVAYDESAVVVYQSYTFTNGTTIYVDFSAMTEGTKGVNYPKANEVGLDYDAAGAGTLKTVTFSADVEWTTNDVFVKTEKAGWAELKFTVPGSGENCAVVAADGASYSWSTYVEPAPVYTVAGSASAFGSNWNVDDAANEMILDGGVYKLTKTDRTLVSGSIEFKVVKNHEYAQGEWPASNYQLAIPEAGVYTIEITFDPANVGDEISATATKTGEAVVTPTITIDGSWDWGNETTLTGDETSVSTTIHLDAGTHYFKMLVNGDHRSNGYYYHRDFPGAEGITENKADMSLGADIAGDYTFTWTFETNAIEITFPAVDYTREGLTAGDYGTICLPKAGTIVGATLYEIGSFENSLIYIDEVGSALAAGVPYIFQATSSKLRVFYTDKTAEDVDASNANGLIGFYNLSNPTATFNIPEDAGNYILYNNQYWLVSGRAAYINNFRAYIKIGSITPKAAAPGRRRVAMTVNGENAAQGFENIESGDAPMKVMIDGTMYILRGEKVYDATGRLVK